MTSRTGLALALCLGCSLAAPAQEGRNEQTFYSKAFRHTTAATRITKDKVDTIYFTQPTDFRRNGTKGTGWRLVLQDEDQSTSESIELSWHGVQGLTPERTAISRSTFTVFGGGTGTVVYIYTLTSLTPTSLPGFVALGIVLPKPRRWNVAPEDACRLHYQHGDQTKVPPALRRQWTWKLDSGTVVPAWTGPEYVGSTFHWGGLYAAPVIQVYNSTNAYGPAREDLFGPESLAFASNPPARQDFLGLRVNGGEEFKTQGSQLSFAGILISGAYRPTPVPLPGLGVLLLGDPFALGFYLPPMNQLGLTKGVPAMAVPGLGVEVVWQAVCVAVDTQQGRVTKVELSSAVRSKLP